MEQPDWLKFRQWHLLLDELCNRAGYFDDATLAAAYCALTGSRGQRQFDTAIRNLNNWRSGRHLPRTANLRILSKLFKVTDDANLQQHWNALYREAREMEGGRAGPVPASGMPAVTRNAETPVRFVQYIVPSGRAVVPAWRSRKRFSVLQMMAGSGAMLVVGAVAGSMITASGWRPWSGPADNAPIVPFKPVLTMNVGDSRPIYAERGDCGKLPRDWPQVEADLPALKTGTFSDGGLARRHSKFCRGLTPARAIVFTATQAGVSEFEIQGDFFKLTVMD
jgi:hypothetical protein